MKFQIKLVIISIYFLAFSNLILDFLGLREAIGSYLMLGVDIIVFYVGLVNLKKNKVNLFFILAAISICSINYLFHDYDVLTFVNGLREILLVFLVFSFYESLTFSKHIILMEKYIQKFIFIFLIIQIPVTLYQFVIFGAGDQVGGTMGNGNSGVLTLTTILMVYVRIKYLRTTIGIKAYYNALFLLPLFVNETKISFILIPLMFLCLSNIKKISTIIPSLLGGLLIFLLLNSLYTNQGRKSENPFSEMFNSDFLENYLFKDDIPEGSDIPRFTKIFISISFLNRDPIDFLFGKEVGAFKGGTTLSRSNFATQYNWLLLGSRPYIFFLLITGGWLLLSLTISFFAYKFWATRGKHWDGQFILLVIAFLIIVLFYNDAYRNQFFCYMYVYFVMLAKGRWLVRKSKVRRSVINRKYGIVLSSSK